MNTKTFLDNIHEPVCCPVCNTRFANPKQLPCLHSFCLHCLQRIQQTSGIRDTTSCPECRRNFTIPGNGDLNAFPTNFRVNSLLDALPVTECNTSGIKCGNCEKTSGESAYCFTCCSFWCGDCLPLHNGLRSNKEHHVLALKDFRDEDFENILKQPTLCGKHEKKKLKFFCQECKIAICNACALTDHEGHAKIVLEDAAKERKSRVEAAIESKKRRALEKMTWIAKIGDNCVLIKERAARVESDVQHFAHSFIAAIEAEKNHIFDEVENTVRTVLHLFGEKRKEIEEYVKMQEAEIEKTELILKRTTNVQLMQPHEFLDQIVQEKAEEEDSGNFDMEHVVAFVFKGNEKLFDDLKFQHIGCFESFITKTIPKYSSAEGKGIRKGTVGLKAEIIVTTRNTQREQCHQERDCVALEIETRKGRDSAIKPQIKDNKDGTYKINYFAKEIGTCQASVKVNGEHVRGSPFKVQVKRRQFRPVLSFGKQGSDAGMLSKPCGVAVNDKDEIAVSECGNHRVQIFSSNGTHLRSFGKKGNRQVEFDWPAGIAFYNDKIIVADANNHRVQLFSDEGHYLNQFGGKGSRDHQLRNPHGLSIDSDGSIIVADTGNELIKIFSLDGRFLRSIGTEGSLIYPFHCIQHDNYLFVSDRGDHCIKVFNRDGEFLYIFGQQGKGDGQFDLPGFLSVDREGHLLVCDTLNDRVQMFKLSGEFITKFRVSGTRAGKIIRPVSTAVLSDGKIIVTDLGSHRVQIFE
ncbi:E3 ubiquitin-protein ligase TRIM71-like [Montipora foliosa]|uniref:E3 ubiquitin-protein ligase TRIM71-like n=1 Tax=Montipora foliosa TaxID=591990 RepID=UPI0035F16490